MNIASDLEKMTFFSIMHQNQLFTLSGGGGGVNSKKITFRYILSTILTTEMRLYCIVNFLLVERLWQVLKCDYAAP